MKYYLFEITRTQYCNDPVKVFYYFFPPIFLSLLDQTQDEILGMKRLFIPRIYSITILKTVYDH